MKQNFAEFQTILTSNKSENWYRIDIFMLTSVLPGNRTPSSQSQSQSRDKQLQFKDIFYLDCTDISCSKEGTVQEETVTVQRIMIP